MEDRKDSLQDFLNQVLAHPLLSSSKLVKYFIEDTDSNFKTHKQEFKGLNPPRSVSECITLHGTAEVYFDKSLTEYCSKLLESIVTLEGIFKE